MTELDRLLEQLQVNLRENGVSSSAAVLDEAAISEILGGSLSEEQKSNIRKSHLTKIAKYTRVEQDSDKIHTFPTLMIDEAPTRNLVKYTAESQKKSVKGWLGTTFLYNDKAESQGSWLMGGGDHQLKANSQFGRIYEASVVKTPKGLIGTLGWFYSVEGVSEDIDSFIAKMNAGIHREVSIHVSVPGGVCCSICEDAFLNCTENTKTKKQPTGIQHYPGEKYGTETCYMSTGSGVLVPLELSAVACPGSVNAHVMSDEEVASYHPVSLSEALGGAHEAIKTIPTKPKPKENIVTEAEKIAEARKKLIETAKTAGVSLAEFLTDAKNATLLTEANVTVTKVEELPDDFKTEATAAGVKLEKTVTPPPAKPKSLFEGKCVVCKRDGTENSEAAIRTEYEEAMGSLVEATTKIKEESEAAVAELPKLKEENVALKTFMVESTVTLAIEKGLKKSEDRAEYTTALSALDFKALEAVRVPMLALPSKEKAEVSVTERLTETMAERGKRTFGETKIETDEKTGEKKVSTASRARFAAAAI